MIMSSKCNLNSSWYNWRKPTINHWLSKLLINEYACWYVVHDFLPMHNTCIEICCQIPCLHVFVLWCPLRLSRKTMFDSFWVGGRGFLFVFIYVYWCPTRFPYRMMFEWFNRNTTGVTRGTVFVNPFGMHKFTPVF